MSETKNTFELQLHDATSSTTAVMVYSIDIEQPSGTLINPTISASYSKFGDLKILRGYFRATADQGLFQPYGLSISIGFNKPVYTTIPQIFTQVVTEETDTLTNSLSTQVLNKTINGFSINLTNTENDYPTGDVIQIDFLVIGS
jgi:hypothetical protein